MISHVTLGSDDPRRAVAFYDPVMATLGLVKVLDVPGAIAYAQSEDAKPWLYILRPFDGGPASVGNGTHVAFLAPSRAAARAFHEAALEAGGQDEGAPGLRPQYSEHYYGAYVRDPDGNKLQAVCYAPGE